jgi:hypothetical protein
MPVNMHNPKVVDENTTGKSTVIKYAH